MTLPAFQTAYDRTVEEWRKFWMTGAAVDFTGSTDQRAFELERRIVLSQYLLRVQCAGSMPPQETGLTYNSWFGKFHLEMHWWHAVQNVLWGREALLEKSMSWYTTNINNASHTAHRQGFAGARWPKMTDPTGADSPSKVGPFLIWQQPHPIYYAELLYRRNPTEQILNRYKEIVFPTADFMASYANFDSVNDRYILGPSLIPAQERFDPVKTINPPFELAYWYWGLSTAQKWRERLHLSRDSRWDNVLRKLSPLAQADRKYLAAESAPDSYSNSRYMTDHPAVLGAYGVLPGSRMVDTSIMRTTFVYILKNWDWNSTWGWDYPMMAMTAVRLGLPETALEILLKDTQKNTYLKNGHNYQDERLRLYLPGNGGLLTAVAMMCAGFDGCSIENPGFPKNDKWVVRWEGLQRIE
jgi:protein-glucosylgalactosylhydroxylysine glucosidase